MDSGIASIIVSIITALATIVTVLISNRATHDKTMAEIKTAQAVTDTKIEGLTREVREHNNFARRMPVVEEKLKVANHRIEDLERRCENANKNPVTEA